MGKFCLNCGRELGADEKFCGGCGTKVPVEDTVNSTEENAGVDLNKENTADNTQQSDTANVQQGYAYGEQQADTNAQQGYNYGEQQADTNAQTGYNYGEQQADTNAQTGYNYGGQQTDTNAQTGYNYGGQQTDTNAQTGYAYGGQQADTNAQQGYNNYGGQQVDTNAQQGYNNYGGQQGYNAQYGYNQQAGGYPQGTPSAKPSAFAPIIAKVKSDPKIAVIGGAGLLVLIVLLIVIINILRFKTIHAEDFLKVKFTGIDGYGSAKVSTDYDKLDQIKFSGNSVKNASRKLAFLGVDYNVDIEPEKNLKNGDKVDITITYDEDDAERMKKLGVKLKDEDIEVTVEGLNKGEQIDFFKGIKLNFEGKDGYGTFDIDKTDAKYDFIYYDYDYDDNLSNGDTVKITAKCSANMQKSGDGYWFEYDGKYYVCKDKQAVKEFKVEGLTPLEELDAFENLKLKTLNGSPYLVVTGVDTTASSSMVKNYVDFNIGESKLYKVGDTVTVTAEASYGLKDQGYKLKETSKTFEITANDYPVYAQESDKAEAYNGLKSQIDLAVDKFKTEKKGTYYLSNVDLDGELKKFKSVNLKSTYFSFTKDTTPSFNTYSGVDIDKVNSIANIYEVKVETKSYKSSKTVTFYILATANNVRKTGGKYTFYNSSYNNKINISTFKSLSDAIEEINTDADMTHGTFDPNKKSESASTTTATTTTTTAAATPTAKTTTTTMVP